MVATQRLLADVGYQSNWFDVLQSDFMRNALLGGTLVAVASGLIGYFVVIRRDSFAAHALAHIGFPGATGAMLVGAPVVAGLAVFCVTGAIAIGAFGKRVDRREVATGTTLAFATSLGVLFASLTTRSSSTVTSVLFGNLLAISTGELAFAALFTVAILGALAVMARPLLFASVSPDVAEARGVPVRTLGIAFLVLLALVVTMAVQVVGTLLLFALVVTPAATALSLTARPAAAVATSAGIACGSVWFGLVLSAMFDLPPSFPIVSLAFAAWLVATSVARPKRHPVVHHDGHHHHDEPGMLA